MFLLIQSIPDGVTFRNVIFTFHNVSINTVKLITFMGGANDLYIPQCFY